MKHKNISNPLSRTTSRSAISGLMLFLMMLVILFYLSQNYRANLINFRKNELKRQVEISLNTIEPFLERLRMGEISRDQALSEILPIVRSMTYRSETMDNYIFMSSYDGIMLVQPLEPWKQETFQLNARDSYGNYFIRDLISTANSPEGEGFTSYFYPPPGADTPGEKLSYVKGIPELRCYIGTGMFFDDIDNLFREYLLGPILIFLLSFSSIYILIIFYMRPLLRCYHFLLDTFHKISHDPEKVPDLPLNQFPENTDEYEILSGFEKMIKTVDRSRIELRNSESRYRHLYEESQGVRIIIDKEGFVFDINNSFIRSLGYERGRFNGRNFREIISPEQDEKVAEMIEKSFSGTYLQALDFDLPDARGNTRTILISEILEMPEEQLRILLTGVDITNRKIAERRAELQREQLIQADKLSSLGVLVSGVAHEINNPNQFILSNAGLLEEIWRDLRPVLDEYYEEYGDFVIQGMNYSEIKQQIPEYIGGMVEGSRRIGKIVSDLKSLSRNDSGRAWSVVNINIVLESAVNLCSNLLRKATDNFELKTDNSIPGVFGSFQKLEQVFINLIQNSVQSLSDRTDRISISTSVSEDGRVKVVIADEGCGIRPSDLKKVFDPFFTTKREKGGTGIGLSISKSIIDEHNGELVYHSRPGRGTVAEIFLNSHKQGDEDV